MHAMRSSSRSFLVWSSIGLLLSTAGCVSAFDPENKGHVVGSEDYRTPFVVTGKGAVRVVMRRAQVGEHAGGVHRAWRAEAEGGTPLTAWLTTMPMVDIGGGLLLHVTPAGDVFAFDPGRPIDSRDQQSHGAMGWYRVGLRGVIDGPVDHVKLSQDGGYETVRAAGDAQWLRVHRPDGSLAGELAIGKGSARATARAGWRLVARARDGAIVLVDESLREQGRIVEQAAEPGEWIDLAAAAPQAWSGPWPFGLGAERELVDVEGNTLPGPWKRIVPLADRSLAALMLIQADGGLTLAEPVRGGLRVLMRDATFALAQSRMVPREYADVGWGEQSPVLLAGQKAAEGTRYVLFAQLDGLLRGPFDADTSEQATATMWERLGPVAAERRAANERARAAVAAAAAQEAAQLQAAVDRNLAKLDAIDREQIAYFEALKAADLAAAGRAIAAMERHREEFFVPQGHVRTEAMRLQHERGHIYFLDWELRREDRSIERLAEHASGFFYQGGVIYERFCREASRLLLGFEGVLSRESYDRLYRSSYGFTPEGKEALAWQLGRIERRDAESRYRAHLAAGRFADAHGMAYQLGFEGWVEHLQTQAKGRVSDQELESLLRAAVQRAPTPELQRKLEAAHHSQWADMMAAQEREQRDRFRRIEEEMRRAAADAERVRRANWAAFKLEAQRRGFLWTGN
mgnify:CR=1 FL=1